MKQKPVHTALQPYLEGKVLLINKPLRWTSFDAVKKVRVTTGVIKVGHAGTLDPLATGLLIICTGKFTKKINEYMGMEKEYTGSFTLGAVTPTYDLESDPTDFKPFGHITTEQIETVSKKLTGYILQVPPVFSAIKKDGKRYYELARQGKEIMAEPRPVTVHEFEVTNIALPVISFRIVCSTGTYIRSLAYDFGAALGTGAYLSSLCRTRIGDFHLADSISPQDFETFVQQLKLSEGKTNA